MLNTPSFCYSIIILALIQTCCQTFTTTTKIKALFYGVLEGVMVGVM